MGSFAIGLLGSRPWIGAIADRRSRKLVLLIGTAVAGIAPFCYLLVQAVPLLILVRIFHGISIAAFATGYIALVADLSPLENRGELLGYMSLINPIGVGIGPAMGGFVQETWGNSTLFLMTGGLGLFGLATISLVQDIPVQKSPPAINASEGAILLWTRFPYGIYNAIAQRLRRSIAETLQLLISPRIRTLTLVLFNIGLAFGAMTTFVSLLIGQTGVNFNGGWFFTAAAVTSFVIRIVTGPLSDRWGRGVFMTISLLLYGISMFVLTFAHTPWLFFLSGLLEGMGFGLMIPTTAAIVTDRAYPHERGQLLGLCLGGFDLGIALAGPIAGVIAQDSSYQTLFAWSTGVVLVALLIFLTLSSKDLSHSFRYALGRGRDIYAL